MEYLIDAKNKLNPETMKEFLDSANASEVTVLITHEDATEEQFDQQSVVKAFEEKCYSVKSNDVLTFATDARALEITGADFDWWTSPRRVKKLFQNDAKPAKKKEPAQIEEHTIIVQFNDEKNMFRGPMKQCVQFINKTYAFMYVKAFAKEDEITITIDDKEPKTMKQLREEGIVA